MPNALVLKTKAEVILHNSRKGEIHNSSYSSYTHHHGLQLTLILVVGEVRYMAASVFACSRCRQPWRREIIILLRVCVCVCLRAFACACMRYVYGCCEYYINPIKASHTHGRLCRTRRTRYTN